MEESIRQQGAAEGETFPASSVLMDASCVLVGEVDFSLLIDRHSRYHTDRSFAFRLSSRDEFVDSIGAHHDVALAVDSIR